MIVRFDEHSGALSECFYIPLLNTWLHDVFYHYLVSLCADEIAGVFNVQEKDLYPMLTSIFISILFNPTQHISL
jgi:hypothetical protein